MHPSSHQPEATAAAGSEAPATAGQPATTDEVGALLGGLDTLDGRPLAEHVEVFEQVHSRLQAALREIDDA